MRLTRKTVRVRQRAAVACCVGLALGSGLGLGLILREPNHQLTAHAGTPERQLLLEIERIHASARDEVRDNPVGRLVSDADTLLLSHIHDIGRLAHVDIGTLETEAIRFTHSLDRVAAGATTASQRDDLVAELDARRDALEGKVLALMSTDRATLRAERSDALESVRRLRFVLAVVSVLGLIGGILLAILAWTVPPLARRPPIDMLQTSTSATEKEPALLH